MPLNTYKTLEKDPISLITDTFSKITADEGAAIQLIIRPFPQISWVRMGERLLFKIKEGKPLRVAIWEASINPIIEFILDVITIGWWTRQFAPRQGARGTELGRYIELQKELRVDERIVKAIEEKIHKQVFETNIRLLSSAQTKERTEEILNHLESALGQFSLFALNSFHSWRLKGRGLRRLVYDFSFRNFNPGQKMLLNVEELTSVYHFPTRFIETPYIKAAKSVTAPPPVELPERGLNLIGKVIFRGEEKKGLVCIC